MGLVIEFYFVTSTISVVWMGSVVSQCCLTTQTDPGATKLKQLDQTIDRVECDVINNITYRDYRPQDGEYFDFIVVGAGSAGSVVANRLSENPSWRVLVLEAGGDPDITSEFPSLSGTLVGSRLDWNYTAELNPRYCVGSVNQRCLWPRGKVLGGTSTINGMLYARGHPADFDSWEEEGNPGWGYGNMLPYFKKSEDLESDIVRENPNFRCYHGVCGVLTVDSKYQDCYFESIYQNISKGFNDLGLGTFNDLNAQYHVGLFAVQSTVRDGRRCSTAKAFLKPAEMRRNLKISKLSLVKKVLVNKKKVAYGVQFEKSGRPIEVYARKEVILSAGVIGSPQLLMLSGIGPEDHLNELGIDVISDLPVGFNLQDQYSLRGYLVGLDVNLSKPDSNEVFLGEVFEDKTTVTINGEGNFVGKITTSKASYPNIQIYFSYYTANSSDAIDQFHDLLGYGDLYKQAVNSINNKSSVYMIFITLSRPESRGRIMLRSTNVKDYPLIYPNYLDKRVDVDALLEGVAFVNELVNTKPFRQVGATVERLDIPDCRPFKFQSADYWKCMMRYSGGSDYHPAGTCRMGPRGSPLSVVDPSLRVIGVSGLRVVDGSIMPMVTNGNTNAPIIAIAEKASDLTKLFWKNKTIGLVKKNCYSNVGTST